MQIVPNCGPDVVANGLPFSYHCAIGTIIIITSDMGGRIQTPPSVKRQQLLLNKYQGFPMGFPGIASDNILIAETRVERDTRYPGGIIL